MKKLIYLIALFCVFSCASNNQNFSDLTSEYIYLEGRVLLNDSWIVSSNIVAFFNDKIITRRYAEDILTIYNCNNDSIIQIGSFAKKGIGPYEFSSVVECYFDQVSYTFYLFGISGGNSVTAYQIDASLIDNLFNTNTWESIVIPKTTNSYFKSFVPLSDTVWLALGGEFDKTNLLSYIHPINGTINELEIHYPLDGIDAKTITKRFTYNAAELLKKPSSNEKFLYYCTNFGNYAEIITFEEGKAAHRQKIAKDYPIYKTAADGMNRESSMETLMGMASYVTDNYIYLLPNFRSRREYLDRTNNNGYPSNHSDTLYVFDWNGNFIKAYKLSKPIRNFVVYPNDSYILGSCDDPESEDVLFIKFFAK